MFCKILSGVVGLFALSALGFDAPASAANGLGTSFTSVTTFQAASAQAGLVGIAVKPGPQQLPKGAEGRFFLQGKKKDDPKAKWCIVGSFKTRAEAERAKATCQRQNPGFDWEVVIQTPSPQVPNRK
ncbi:MAG: hypothetical protein HYR84_07520 [Planctomycetes bacterium]|nr:hypothetical protein [Planctomycetota bacterium]